MSISMQKIKPQNSNEQIHTTTQDENITALAIEINKLYATVNSERAENILAIKDVQQNMANISHDLRTPLTSIIGYLDLLASPTCTPAEQKEYLAICQRKSKSLQVLVQGLFELSRLESQEYPFHLEKLNALSILQEELANSYDLFTIQNIIPNVIFTEQPLWIINDPQVLPRIFANLLNNIVKHGNGKEVAIKATEDANNAIFIFENSAPELSPQDVENIFERFFIKDKMRSGENTGIGLSLVKEFVLQTGGTIHVKKADDILRIFLQWKKIN